MCRHFNRETAYRLFGADHSRNLEAQQGWPPRLHPTLLPWDRDWLVEVAAEAGIHVDITSEAMMSNPTFQAEVKRPMRVVEQADEEDDVMDWIESVRADWGAVERRVKRGNLRALERLLLPLLGIGR